MPSPPGPKGRLDSRRHAGIYSRQSGFHHSRAATMATSCACASSISACFFSITRPTSNMCFPPTRENFIKSRTLRSPFFQRLVGNGLLTSEGDDGGVSGVWRNQLSSSTDQRLRRCDGRLYETHDCPMAGRRSARHPSRHDATYPGDRRQDLFNADVSGDADKVGQLLSQIVKPFASTGHI